MKVWVLQEDHGPEGESIIGICSSADNAERVKAERRNGDDEIVEWDLDERLDWKYGPDFFVSIDAHTKDILASDEWSLWRHPSDSVAHCPYHHGGGQVRANARSTISMEHAVELARAAADRWLEGRI